MTTLTRPSEERRALGLLRARASAQSCHWKPYPD
jgi:hypothetical protein